jgi:large subunit ribosomal protein L4e
VAERGRKERGEEEDSHTLPLSPSPVSTMTTRPTVTVFDHASGAPAGSATLPCVMGVPIRPDIVSFVHTQMAKNKRQPYAVSKAAGHQTSAESWGTGRAVARIPRVGGGGTQRSGQGAFGNMCRSGRMFAPTKTWRRWHRKINVNQKRYALASALAASAVPALVMARGHRVDQVPELPLVVDNGLQGVKKTAKALEAMGKLGAEADCTHAKESKKLRAGKGKMRNRRYVMRRGPLIIYDSNDGLDKAFRNLPGVETVCVDRLNLLQLAPGGHMGRFCVWTQAAFEKLDTIYGTYETKGSKVGYMLPRQQLTNADVSRIINSDEVQSIVKEAKPEAQVHHLLPKRNPLKHVDVMEGLSPYQASVRKAEKAKEEQIKAKRAEFINARRAAQKATRKEKKGHRAAGQAFYQNANKEGDVKF